MKKSELLSLLNQIQIFSLAATLFVFPLLVLPMTTNPFILPKQLLLIACALLSLVCFGVSMIVSQKVVFKRTPFDLPILLVLLAFLFSSLFAVNRWDSLIAFTPVLFAGILYFVLVNTLEKEKTWLFLVGSLVLGGCLVAVVSAFSYFKVYPLPVAFTHVQNFSTLGTLLEQLVFFLFLLPLCLKEAYPLLKGNTETRPVSFAAATLILVAGILVSIVQLLTTQKPVLLPYDSGFQTAFAAISQDTGRILQGFLFGSGFGNYLEVFSRFKQATFNTNPNWFIPFSQSSSLVLEILATTGLLGLLSVLFLLFRMFAGYKKKVDNSVFFSLVVIAVAMFIIPFSFIGMAMLFVLLGLFATQDAKKHPSLYDEFEFRFVALKKGMFSIQPYVASEKHEYFKATTYALAGVILLFVGLSAFYIGKYALSDMAFQNSLVSAQNNNGIQTYRQEIQAISLFPYQSAYYRIFSQTNIALANSLAASQPRGSSPSATVQNTVITLIQQGINAARNATTYSPQNVSNWQNLASVYRSLFGFGQNAENFAILAGQQAIQLDPTNPQEYIALGGIYYQLGQYDNAVRAFQQAVQLKQDYANAYYNLGHAYEQKGDLQNALAAYQAVQQLVASDKASSQKITAEITALQAKIGNQQTQTVPANQKSQTSTAQQPLNLSGQTQTLPPQPTQIPLAGPSGNPSPSPTPTPGK